MKKLKDDDVGLQKKNILKTSKTLDNWPVIEGYNFEENFDFEKFMNSYVRTGFQATNLGIAIDVIKEMRKNNAKIFLGFTSNMISCGLRESIKYLVKNNFVHVLSTTGGGIEEDIIKCFKPFVLGDYRARGDVLLDEGINRTGNIFCPNDRYIYFERFMNPFLQRLYDMQKKREKIIDIVEFVYELGHELELNNVEKREESYIFWAYKNKINMYCPALLDGSIGDMIYFFKKNNPDFKIDTSDYIVSVNDEALYCEKMGMICLGGSVPKHLIANAGLFREGIEYAVYINTGLEMEGSNAGATVDEAVSWGKIRKDAKSVKVECEATLVFPLLVAMCFKFFNN